MDKYTFTISFLGSTRQVYPLGDFTISLSKEDDQVFLRKLLNSDFEFTDRKEGDDFTYFYDIDQSCDRCEPMILNISCNGNTIAEGVINMNKSKFEKPKATMKVDPFDIYTDVLENWEKQYNILGAVNTMVEVLGAIGTIQTTNCSRVAASLAPFQAASPYDCDTVTGLPAQGYAAYRHNVDEDGPGIYTQNTDWARTFVAGTVQPPGVGWVAVAGGFARPVTLGTTNITTDDHPFSFEYTIVETEDGTVNGDSAAYDNGVQLRLALQRVQAPEVRSHFFSINPIGIGIRPATQVYTDAEALSDIIMYQISDIYQADANQNATKALVSLKEFLDWFATMEVYWWMENIGGVDVMRIEHISAINAVVELDATSVSRGFYSYSEDFPNVEIYQRESQESLSFQMPNIVYGKCSDPESEVTRKTDRLYTDLAWAIENEDQINKDSFFMMAAVQFDGKFYVSVENINVPYQGIIPRQNGHLSWLNLRNNYIKYNRPQKSATTATETLTFETTKRNRIESDLRILMCCEDFINFDGEGLVTTQIGDGEIISGEWDSRSEYLTIELAHDQNC